MSKNLRNTLKKEMNNKERNAALELILQCLKNDKLSCGTINAAAITFTIHCSITSQSCGCRQRC